MSATSRLSRRITAAVVGAATVGAAMLHVAPANAAGASTIAGAVFQDLNRNGVQDAGEAPFNGMYLDLLDSSGQLLNATVTDSAGGYQFTGLAAGTYTIQVESQSWVPIDTAWTPTTTGSLYPKLTVSVSGSARGDLGFRPVAHSTDASAPLSSYTSSTGTKVNSYDDLLSASQVFSALSQVSLLGDEAPATTVNFDYGTQNYTSVSVSGTAGSFSNYRATVYITLQGWLDSSDRILDHEYGHAWSNFYADMVQQDDTFSAYLKVRGIDGDPRLDTSHAWDRHELIAEDFRQLFGSATAQLAAQENSDLPPASQVSGLRDYLSTTFRQAPAGPTPTGTTTSSTATPPAPAVTGLAVNPSPVTKSGTVSFSLSSSSAVTVQIMNSKGTVIRTLLNSVAEPSGSMSLTWDRRDANGSRVKSGTYSVRVTAVDAYAQTGTATRSFSVS